MAKQSRKSTSLSFATAAVLQELVDRHATPLSVVVDYLVSVGVAAGVDPVGLAAHRRATYERSVAARVAGGRLGGAAKARRAAAGLSPKSPRPACSTEGCGGLAAPGADRCAACRSERSGHGP